MLPVSDAIRHLGLVTFIKDGKLKRPLHPHMTVTHPHFLKPDLSLILDHFDHIRFMVGNIKIIIKCQLAHRLPLFLISVYVFFL